MSSESWAEDVSGIHYCHCFPPSAVLQMHRSLVRLDRDFVNWIHSSRGNGLAKTLRVHYEIETTDSGTGWPFATRPELVSITILFGDAIWWNWKIVTTDISIYIYVTLCKYGSCVVAWHAVKCSILIVNLLFEGSWVALVDIVLTE